MIKMISPLLHNKRQIVGLILLLIAAFVGNYTRWTLFFDIDFICGSIAVWLVVGLYGMGWGTLAGFLSGLCTYVIWKHPYTVITFTVEALVVAWLFYRRRQHNILLLDGLFWLVLGMPMVWVIYRFILGIDPTQALIILCKQPVNGIFNALIASLILTHTPIHRWFDRPPVLRSLSLQQTLFNLLVAFVTVPTLLLIILASYQVVDDIKTTVSVDLQNASRYLKVEVEGWYERRVMAVKGLAQLAIASGIDSPIVKQNITFLENTFPEFRTIHVFDAQGNRIEAVSADAIPLFDQAAVFAEIERSPQPVITPIPMAPDSNPQPLALLASPIQVEGQILGAIVAELDLTGISQLLQANLEGEELRILVLDQTQRAAASTKPEWIGEPNFNWRRGGRVEEIAAPTYQWFPTGGSPLVMVQWENSWFVREAPLNSDVPWTLIVQMAATSHVQQIERVHTRNMALLLIISGLALGCATLVSRGIIRPLLQLATLTTNLPDRLLAEEPIPWMQSSVTELALLLQNFRLMAASLQEKFQELKQSNTLLMQAQHVARMGSWQLNTQTRQVTWSPELFEMLGFDSHQPPPTDPEQQKVFPPEDWRTLQRELKQAIRSGESYALDLAIIRPDGSSGYIFTKGEPIKNAQGQVIQMLGIAMDITQRKKTEAQIQHTAQQLALANKELESFSYSVSHDLRAPLRAIDGFTRMLQEDYSQSFDSEANRYLKVIRDNAQRMGELIEDLLRLSRLNQKQIQRERVNFNEIIQAVLNDLQWDEGERSLTWAIAPLPPCAVDPSLFKQVWVNLLSNAIKYTSKTAEAHIEIGHQIINDEGVYFIQDNGAGFDMQYAEQLFGVFQRLHRSQDFEGTGIGLAIVQRIIQRHGGRIWAQAAINQGATFYFTLPDV